MWYYDEAKCRQWRLVVILGRSIRPCCTVACTDTWLIELISICDSYFIVASLLPHCCLSHQNFASNILVILKVEEKRMWEFCVPYFPGNKVFISPGWRAAEGCREFESWFVNTSLASGNSPSTPSPDRLWCVRRAARPRRRANPEPRGQTFKNHPKYRKYPPRLVLRP